MGGLAISKLEEKPRRSSAYTCPNVSCGRVFTKPIKVLNLQQASQAPYDACPFCFTEIAIKDEMPVLVDEAKETVAEEKMPAEGHVENYEKPSGCSYYLGYLSERSSKNKIPDECMMCRNIVECMLKKAK
ncbi:MAG: hypothetical protein QXD19_06075 [Candidatus Bathyarchaeia archaeon]